MDDIEFYKKNTVNINISMTGVDLTGATVYFTVKEEPDEVASDTTALIKKDVTEHTDPTHGITVIALTPTDTNVVAGKHRYDIKLKKADGSQTTIKVGKCRILDTITNRG